MLMPSIFNDNLFDDFFDFPFYDDKADRKIQRKLYGHHAGNLMKTDIKEFADGYELQMDLPGYKKEEIQAALHNGYLTISATKSVEEKEEGKYLRRERYTGSCQRSFYVGEYLRQEDIKAGFQDGILTLFVPKEDKTKVEEKKYITIQ